MSADRLSAKGSRKRAGGRGGLALAWVAALACAPIGSLQASPLRDPQRVIGGQSINLTPLFQWWTNHVGDRPLSAWAHVTGSVVSTRSWGWLVVAHIDNASSKPGTGNKPPGAGMSKILLRDPPTRDLATFELLAAQLKNLNQERQGLSSQTVEIQRLAAEPQNRRNRLRARALAQTEKAAKDRLKLLDQQIKGCRTKLVSFPNSTNYVVDCFALDLQQTYEGTPEYDYGAPMR